MRDTAIESQNQPSAIPTSDVQNARPLLRLLKWSAASAAIIYASSLVGFGLLLQRFGSLAAAKARYSGGVLYVDGPQHISLPAESEGFVTFQLQNLLSSEVVLCDAETICGECV